MPPSAKDTAEDVAKDAPTIDTSKMSKQKREALELTEDSRDELKTKTSFAASLFMGAFDIDRLLPYPEQSKADKEAGDPFLGKLETILREDVNPDEIDNFGQPPPRRWHARLSLCTSLASCPYS